MKLLNSAFLAWGLAGLLMLMLVVLAFLHRRHIIKERAAILIIVAGFILALMALTVHIE